MMLNPLVTTKPIHWATRRPDLISIKRIEPARTCEVPVPQQQKIGGGYSDEFVRPFLQAVMRAVARHFGVSQTRIKGRSRPAEVVAPRHTFYALARELTPANSRQIGELVNRDHSTVLVALNNPLPISASALETVRVLARREMRKIKALPTANQLAA
jgi:hypothetical protein